MTKEKVDEVMRLEKRRSELLHFMKVLTKSQSISTSDPFDNVVIRRCDDEDFFDGICAYTKVRMCEIERQIEEL